MPKRLYTNNAKATLVAALPNTAGAGATFSVSAGKGLLFPAPSNGDYFDVTVQDSTTVEIIRISARTSDVFTILSRAMEGTVSPASFAAGTVISLRVTAGTIQDALAHQDVTTGAHAASAVSNAPSGAITETTVQAALNGLETRKATPASVTSSVNAAIAAHVSEVDPHPVYTTEAELSSALAGKSNIGHTHTSTEVTGLGTAATKNTGVATGEVPLVGTESATTSLAGLVRKSTTAENAAGTGTGVVAAADLPTAVAALATNNGEFRTMQVFTASGTYTKPTGLKRVKVTVVGGGGQGGTGDTVAPGGGGAAGGTAIKIIEAGVIGATEAVTVGSGGSGPASNGAAGATSSFGAHCSATGGAGGVALGNGGAAGTPGGVGSNGSINIRGGTGLNGNSTTVALAGGSIFGADNHGSGAYGGGGAGVVNASGIAGGAGVVIVEEFF